LCCTFVLYPLCITDGWATGVNKGTYIAHCTLHIALKKIIRYDKTLACLANGRCSQQSEDIFSFNAQTEQHWLQGRLQSKYGNVIRWMHPCEVISSTLFIQTTIVVYCGKHLHGINGILCRFLVYLRHDYILNAGNVHINSNLLQDNVANVFAISWERDRLSGVWVLGEKIWTVSWKNFKTLRRRK
jgi:hypothetical protein